MTTNVNLLELSKQILCLFTNMEDIVKVDDVLSKTSGYNEGISIESVLKELIGNELIVSSEADKTSYKITELGNEVNQLWKTKEGSNLIERYGLDEIRNYIKEFNLDKLSVSK